MMEAFQFSVERRCWDDDIKKVFFVNMIAPYQRISSWAPPLDLLKINTDGVFNDAVKTGAWGFIVRDYAGAVMAACAGPVV